MIDCFISSNTFNEFIELKTSIFESENPKAILVISHGMAEHRKRYYNFCEFLSKNNIITFVYDQRGHGETCGSVEKQGYMSDKDNFQILVEDINVVVEEAKKRYPYLPVFVLGHSMGSFLVQRYMELYPKKVKGIILSGTNYTKSLLYSFGKIVADFVVKFTGRKKQSLFLDKLSFGSYNKQFKPNRTKFDWLSTDNEIVDKYINDPFCGYVFSSSYYRDLLKGFKEISKNFNKISQETPIYIFSGDKDPVSNNGKGVTKLYNVLKDEYKVKNLKVKLYKDYRHETLNEIGKDIVYNDTLSWIKSYIY